MHITDKSQLHWAKIPGRVANVIPQISILSLLLLARAFDWPEELKLLRPQTPALAATFRRLSGFQTVVT